MPSDRKSKAASAGSLSHWVFPLFVFEASPPPLFMVPPSPRCQCTLALFGLDISCEGRRGKEKEEAQIINYLCLSGFPVGYLVNFRNSRVEWKRFVNTRA